MKNKEENEDHKSKLRASRLGIGQDWTEKDAIDLMKTESELKNRDIEEIVEEVKDNKIGKERLWTCPKPECRSTLRRHYESNFDTGEERTICIEYCEVEGCGFIHHFLEPKQEPEEKMRIKKMVEDSMDKIDRESSRIEGVENRMTTREDRKVIRKEAREAIWHDFVSITRLLHEMSENPLILPMLRRARERVLIDKQLKILKILKPPRYRLLSYIRWRLEQKRVQRLKTVLDSEVTDGDILLGSWVYSKKFSTEKEDILNDEFLF